MFRDRVAKTGDRMYTVRFLDGTSVPDDYQKTVATLINTAYRAEEIFPVDELEMACDSTPTKKDE